MSDKFLSFEEPIAELKEKIASLRLLRDDSGINIADEIGRLEDKCHALTEQIFKNLTPWQITQLARHPLRPHASDFINMMCTDIDEIHGDRQFADDQALLGALARIDGQSVLIVGQEKGRETKDKILRNFGMVHPEGYRKALRLFRLAERFKLPIITLIDTPGAYPGVDAEARGQSEAIARNLIEMADLNVPVICCILGEGCSGGALGIGVGDRTLMFQYAYYATISPEGCATILWKSAERAPEAAAQMNMTADKLLEQQIVDAVIPEPLGGAHRNPQEAAQALKEHIKAALNELRLLDVATLKEQRYQRLMRPGALS